MQGQFPATVVPIPVPIQAGYPQTGKTHVAPAATVAYAPYPQPLSAYPALYPNPQSQYPAQPHLSYATQPTKKETFGLPAASSASVAGYPYYVTKP